MKKQICTQCGKAADVLVSNYRKNMDGTMIIIIGNDEKVCRKCAGKRKGYKTLFEINNEMNPITFSN